MKPFMFSFLLTGQRIIQFCNSPTNLPHNHSDVSPLQILKTHISLRNFHRAHRDAEVIILTNRNLLLYNEKGPIFSKLPPTFKPIACKIMSHILVATTHSKNRWLQVPTSSQNMQVLSLTTLLFGKLSLVRVLFLDNNYKKKCTLDGTFNFKTADTKTSNTPL